MNSEQEKSLKTSVPNTTRDLIINFDTETLDLQESALASNRQIKVRPTTSRYGVMRSLGKF